MSRMRRIGRGRCGADSCARAAALTIAAFPVVRSRGPAAP
ncbi:hypothetical protein LG3211_3149 [Lysobacter gummosus]|nr:hypothetical protein LG3211_3149 [Lysobacter gummosus]